MATAARTTKDSDCVCKYRGCLALCFAADSPLLAELTRILEQQSGATPHAFARLPIPEWHITLVTKAELRTLSAAAVAEAAALSPTRVFPVGLGGAVPLGVYFIVCVWPRAQAFRKRHGLPLKVFHVSVSEQNNHEVDKSVTALLITEASWMEALSVDALEAVARQVLLEGESQQAHALRVATHLCAKFGAQTTRGWLRLGEAALRQHRYKLAMLSFAHAYDRVSRPESVESSATGGTVEDPGAVQRFCLAGMQACSAFTEWGQVFLEREAQEVPPLLAPFLQQQRWSNAICSAVRESARGTDRCVPSRERLWVVSRMPRATGSPPLVRLPRFFRWIVPFQLAAMSTPRDEADVVHLARSVGVRHVVTLTREQPLPRAWFPSLPNAVANTFLPVTNYAAPSLTQIDQFIKICCDTTGVLVHCGGGKGRAGVMVACYLVAFGFSAPPPSPMEQWVQPAMAADEAIRTLRAIRPGSIETERQEAVVAAYSSLLWKRRSVLPALVAEPPVSTPLVSGAPLEGTDLLVLCGLPGSGKTTFRQMLVKRSRAAGSTKLQHAPVSERWVELSGDEHGRDGCERSLGLTGVQRAILDRVNGKQADRRAFLELASMWSTHATAVWFDFAADVCEYRAQQRADHPTLSPGRRVANAIAQHAREFVAPALDEGFATVVRLTSLQAVGDLVLRLSPPIGLLRFPRTSHVIDLGAATPDDLVMAHAPGSLPLLPPRSSLDEPSETGDVVVVTEKVDGANLGISLAADGWTFVVQNRSHYVNSRSHVQFRKLDAFLEAHGAVLRAMLHHDPLFPERFILYGEWLAATHSIPYTRLRGLFYAFDLYDREARQFWDRRSLEALVTLAAADPRDRIPIVPTLWTGCRLPDNETLIAMAQQTRSQLYDGVVEGLYLKWEAPGVGVRHRGKVVRGDFLAGNEHWSTGAIRLNTVLPPGFDEAAS
ncbi:hypothetical protein PybrP1_000664 [[Pythium] brassicae (nom. inval.)]|nr:hypothetical protein PybrP1_000664 [[Pythium] brassicae (nom. inval.)]